MSETVALFHLLVPIYSFLLFHFFFSSVVTCFYPFYYYFLISFLVLPPIHTSIRNKEEKKEQEREKKNSIALVVQFILFHAFSFILICRQDWFFPPTLSLIFPIPLLFFPPFDLTLENGRQPKSNQTNIKLRFGSSIYIYIYIWNRKWSIRFAEVYPQVTKSYLTYTCQTYSFHLEYLKWEFWYSSRPLWNE